MTKERIVHFVQNTKSLLDYNQCSFAILTSGQAMHLNTRCKYWSISARQLSQLIWVWRFLLWNVSCTFMNFHVAFDTLKNVISLTEFVATSTIEVWKINLWLWVKFKFQKKKSRNYFVIDKEQRKFECCFRIGKISDFLWFPVYFQLFFSLRNLFLIQF